MDKADHQDKAETGNARRGRRAYAAGGTSARSGLAAAVALLRAHGLAVTAQRLLLVEVARAMPGHFTARAVHEQMERTYPGISVVSVYRGLETFREMGLVTRTNLGGSIEHYEWVAGPRHHHLICLACGRLLLLDDAEMDGLRERLLSRYGFQASIDHHAIFGLCQDCAGQDEQALD